VVHYNENNEQIKFITGQDTIYFTVKTSAQTVQKSLQKVVTNFDSSGEAVIEILPEETKDLRFGQYVYDVQ
jgi:UDP:flavonoid glycosyltransferase YjiC (YdhE family)